ncbi:ribonuclease P protein component [Ichthyenterobacterium sp. W332]|uniref:Ribonuclease P protein component n=1 Tax=Microcosmobacter mediterraneus TaxID=3075607 RepID=A0ABU2YIK5_9FLAO|nr:ribonuclease P protein component [Ichthyenterobacterium sp. W332]MDT0558009.1 ribonuclease P protein component [Ichthyenterobacterium sp. W332]
MKTTFSKTERLKSKQLIDKLFYDGKSVSQFPLKLIYLKTEFNDGSVLKTGVSVSKRLFKNAVDRNRIKRLLREAFRLNKAEYFNNSSTSYAFMILYISNDGATFEVINENMKRLLNKFKEKTSEV